MANESDLTYYLLEDGSGHYALEDASGALLKDPQGYAQVVIDDGPIAYWRFGESSSASPAANLVGASGTYVGSPTVGVTGALDDDTDTAVNLDGTTQYVTATGSNSYTPNSGDLTIECWVRPTSVKSPTLMQIALTSGAFTLSLDVTSTLFSFIVSGVFTAGTMQTNRKIALGAWYHVAATFETSTTTCRGYINGYNLDEGSGSTPTKTDLSSLAWNGSGLLFIGVNRTLGATSFVVGDIDEFAIYPSALTADQIARHYRCGLQFLPDIHPPMPSIAAH